MLKEHPELSENSSSGYDFISWPENSDGDGIDPDPEDAMPQSIAVTAGLYHGAHVAGTVAAAGNNGEGIAGVAFDVSLMHLRALDGGCGEQLALLRLCVMPLASRTIVDTCRITRIL